MLVRYRLHRFAADAAYPESGSMRRANTTAQDSPNVTRFLA